MRTVISYKTEPAVLWWYGDIEADLFQRYGLVSKSFKTHIIDTIVGQPYAWAQSFLDTWGLKLHVACRCRCNEDHIQVMVDVDSDIILEVWFSSDSIKFAWP